MIDIYFNKSDNENGSRSTFSKMLSAGLAILSMSSTIQRIVEASYVGEPINSSSVISKEALKKETKETKIVEQKKVHGNKNSSKKNITNDKAKYDRIREIVVLLATTAVICAFLFWPWLNSPAPISLPKKIDSAGKDLRALVGLDNFKELVEDFGRSAKQVEEDLRIDIKRKKPLLHMVIKGNPGVGKTTIAKMLAEEYYKAGLIPQKKILVTERSNFIGRYMGQTEENTAKIFAQAKGGVLFIDEAYTLAVGSEQDYGRHVIEALLTAMDTNEFVVIIAGYPKPMEAFLHFNPGLNRRFVHKISLSDYTAEQLCEMFKNICVECGFKLENGSEAILKDHFKIAKQVANFGNAGYVRTFFDSVLRSRDRKLSLDAEADERKIIKNDYISEAANLLQNH